MRTRVLSVALVAALSALTGCEGMPFFANLQEAFGPGLHLDTGAHVKEIAANSIAGNGLIFSPDGRRYAYLDGRNQNRIHVGNASGEARATKAYAGTVGELWWTPDGTRLAYFERNGLDENAVPRYALKVLTFETGEIRTLRDEVSHSSLPWFAWAPDGRGFVYTERKTSEPSNGGVQLFYMAEGSEPLKIADVPFSDGGAVWSPDGSELAYRAEAQGFIFAHNLMIYRVSEGKSRFLRRIPTHYPFIWETSGESIGYLESGIGPESMSGKYTLHKIKVADGSDEATPFEVGGPDGKGGYGLAMQLSPDLRWCVVLHGGSPLFSRELATGKQAQLTSHIAATRSWTADSQALIVSTTKGNMTRYYRVQVVR